MQDRALPELQWTHGGIALGPKPRDYSYELPKKVKRLALKSAFSTKVADNDLIVVDNIAVEGFKTKSGCRDAFQTGCRQKALIVMPELDQKLIKSAANIPGVKTALVNTINVYDILNYDKFIVAKGALEKIGGGVRIMKNCTRHHPEACYHRG